MCKARYMSGVCHLLVPKRGQFAPSVLAAFEQVEGLLEFGYCISEEEEEADMPDSLRPGRSPGGKEPCPCAFAPSLCLFTLVIKVHPGGGREWFWPFSPLNLSPVYI